MKAQLDTRIISSFLLYVDHVIQRDGQAYQNTVTRFYPATSPIANNFVYTAPIKPLCNDASISGANIMSGVWIGPTYIKVGQSGLRAINHYQAALYFTGSRPSGLPISGSVAQKEINIKLTDKPDWKLMFETQYVTNNTNPVTPFTGVPLDAETSPVIFMRTKVQENKPFGFAKLDNQTINMRAIVIAENEFQKTAVVTILKNLNYHAIPLPSSLPFDALGNMTGQVFNYDALPLDTSVTPIIFGVKAIDVPQQGDYKNIVRNMAIVDFEISTIAKS